VITFVPKYTVMEAIKLTQYSHGAGCGCKISPRELTTILKTNLEPVFTENLLVGIDTRDDAAVYDIGNGKGIISTTDFFLPIVDDPFTFGQIAATNAISDVYAMGGTPLMAIAILGWPVNKIPSSVANQVIEGGREVCRRAGIPLAGGHSIDNPEPLFGLAVTGMVPLEHLKRNDTAEAGCKLYLTKPLGIGALSTAQKEGKLKQEHETLAPDTMLILNQMGSQLAPLKSVKAVTDVTGFGLLGHLLEMCEGSNLEAELNYSKIPVLEPALDYIAQGCIPGGTKRNLESYGDKIQLANDSWKWILADPQTSGGLLIAVDVGYDQELEALLQKNRLYASCIGELKKYKGEKRIFVG
jgi:selenide,water dikinase